MEAWDWSTVLVVAALISCLVLIILIWCDLLRPAVIKVERFQICLIISAVAVVRLIVVILIRLVRLVVIIALVVVLVLAAAIAIACQRIVVSFLGVLVVWILRLIWSSSIWVVVDGLNLLCGR